MKQLLIHLVLMAITFSLGLGFEWLIPKRKSKPLDKWDLVVPKVVEAHPEAVSATTPTSNLIFDYDPLRFIPDGTYFNNDPTPREFREFNGFDVVRIEIEGQLLRYVGIQTYSNNVYSGQPALFALVTDRRLFFATDLNQNGLKYLFDGEFIRDPDSNADTSASVLYGKLTKFEFGRKIAECELNFRLQRIGR